MNQKLTIIFDLDGTLVDTAPDLLSAHNHVMKKFGYTSRNLDEILNENGFNKGIEIFSDDKQLYYLRQGGISLKPPALSRPLFGFKLNIELIIK